MTAPRIPNLDALLGRAAEPNEPQSVRCGCGATRYHDRDTIGRLVERCDGCGHCHTIQPRRMVAPTPGALPKFPPSIGPRECACGCGEMAQPVFDRRHEVWRPAPKYATDACRARAASDRAQGHAARLRAAGTLVTVNVRRGAA